MQDKSSDRNSEVKTLAFEDRVSVTKKWRALPFKKKKKKKKLAPDVLLITLCFILLGPEKKLAEKNALFTLDARGKRFFRGFTPDLYFFYIFFTII